MPRVARRGPRDYYDNHGGVRCPLSVFSISSTVRDGVPLYVGRGRNMQKDGRSRNWALVVYPDSVPENWLQILDDMHIKALVSPLHDKDVNADGTPKKPHWHVLLMYDGNKYLHQVKDDVSIPLNGTIPIAIQSAHSYGRYLIHMDNPEKVQYKRTEIKSFGGVDVDRILASTVGNRHECLRAMRKYIREHSIYSFADFLDYCDENNPEWSDLLDDNCTMVISQYIKSRIYDRRDVTGQQIRALQEENARLQNSIGILDKKF